MLKILQRRLPAALSDEEAALVQQGLQVRFKSLLYGVRLEYLRRLDLEMEDLPVAAPPAGSLAAGELFMPVPGTVLYFKVPRGAGYIEAGAIATEDASGYENFFDEIREAVLAAHGPVGEWDTLRSDLDRLDIDDGRPGDDDLSEDQLEASRVLMEDPSRTLLGRFLQAGSTFLDRFETDDREGDQARIARFEGLGLVTKELAVLCRKTGQQILRVASRATIEESSQKGFKCFICGSPIANERVDELVSCTELGERLLHENHWMLVLVEGTLNRLGVPAQDMVVHAREGGPILIYLTVSNQQFLLVLTSERLTLEQSYMISAPLAAHGIANAVLVSSTKISTLMQHHLRQTNPGAEFFFVDSLARLDDRLREILVDRQRRFLRELLDPLSDLTPVRVQELVLRKMVPEPEPVAARSSGAPRGGEDLLEGPPVEEEAAAG